MRTLITGAVLLLATATALPAHARPDLRMAEVKARVAADLKAHADRELDDAGLVERLSGYGRYTLTALLAELPDQPRRVQKLLVQRAAGINASRAYRFLIYVARWDEVPRYLQLEAITQLEPVVTHEHVGDLIDLLREGYAPKSARVHEVLASLAAREGDEAHREIGMQLRGLIGEARERVDDPQVRKLGAEALAALARLDGVSALPDVVGAIGSPGTRRAALGLLIARIDRAAWEQADPRPFLARSPADALLALVRNELPATQRERSLAVKALARWGDLGSIPELLTYAEENPKAKVADVLDACRQIGHKRYDSLEAWNAYWEQIGPLWDEQPDNLDDLGSDREVDVVRALDRLAQIPDWSTFREIQFLVENLLVQTMDEGVEVTLAPGAVRVGLKVCGTLAILDDPAGAPAALALLEGYGSPLELRRRAVWTLGQIYDMPDGPLDVTFWRQRVLGNEGASE